MVSGSSWQTDSVHLYLAGDEDITGFLPDIIYKGTLLQIRFKVKVNKLTVYVFYQLILTENVSKYVLACFVLQSVQ